MTLALYGKSNRRRLALVVAALCAVMIAAVGGSSLQSASAGTPSNGAISDLKGKASSYTGVVLSSNSGIVCTAQTSTGSVLSFSSSITFTLTGTAPAGSFFRVYLDRSTNGQINPSDVTGNQAIVDTGGMAGGVNHTVPISISVTSPFTISQTGVLLRVANDAGGAVFSTTSNALSCASSPVVRTIRIIKVTNQGAPAQSFAGSISPHAPGGWSVAGGSTTDVPNVVSVSQTIKEDELPPGWAFVGYKWRAGLFDDCSAVTAYTGIRTTGVVVGSTGPYTICIKNAYTAPVASIPSLRKAPASTPIDSTRTHWDVTIDNTQDNSIARTGIVITEDIAAADAVLDAVDGGACTGVGAPGPWTCSVGQGATTVLRVSRSLSHASNALNTCVAGTIGNRVSAQLSQADGATALTGSPATSADIPVPGVAGPGCLSLSKVVHTAGNAVDGFTITLSNSGPATTVNVTDTFSAGGTGGTLGTPVVTSSPPSTCMLNDLVGAAGCTLNVAANDQSSIFVPLSGAANGTCAPLTLTNTAFGRWQTSGGPYIAPGPAGSAVTVQYPVTRGNCTLAITLGKTDDTGHTVAAGETFHWTLAVTVSNVATEHATTIADTAPAGMTFLGVVPDAGFTACSVFGSGTQVSCLLPADTEPGTYSVMLLVQAPLSAAPASCRQYTNTLTGDYHGTPLDPAADVVTVTGCTRALTLNKVVTNGFYTASPSDFTMTIGGTPSASGPGTASVAATIGLTYVLGESGSALHFHQAEIACDSEIVVGADGAITVPDGTGSLTCTITNASDPEPPTALEVSKTVSTSFDRAIDWDIVKAVDQDHFDLNTTDRTTGTAAYTVTATKHVVESNFRATGTIAITNPASTLTAHVTDVSDSIPGAVITGCDAPFDVPPGASRVCDYVIGPSSSPIVGPNTATVSTTGDVIGATSAVVQIVFTEPASTSGPSSVTVNDTFEPAHGPVSDTATWSYSHGFDCAGVDWGEGFTGSYSRLNTAAIDGVPGKMASAIVTVNCTDSRPGTIVIVKNYIDHGDAVHLEPEVFIGTTPATIGENAAEPGMHHVSETPPAGWKSVGLPQTSCAGYASPQGELLLGDDVRLRLAYEALLGEVGVDVTVAPGGTCAITFTNERETGHIQVVKELIRQTNLIEHGSFNLQIGGTTFATTPAGQGGQTPAIQLATGAYSVGEAATSGTNLGQYTAHITCVRGAESVLDATGPSATVTLNEGDDIVCTISNSRNPVLSSPKLTVRKLSDPAGDGMQGNLAGGWPITITCTSGAQPGFTRTQTTGATGAGLGVVLFDGIPECTYAVSEPGSTPGWKVVGSRLDNGPLAGGAARSDVVVASDISPTVDFYNQPLVNVRVIKTEVDGATATAGQGWDITLGGCGKSGIRGTTVAGGVFVFENLPPCPAYTVSENTESKPGFVPAGPASVVVAATTPGHTYEVAFTNTKITVCTLGCSSVLNTPAATPSPAAAARPAIVTPTTAAEPADGRGAVSTPGAATVPTQIVLGDRTAAPSAKSTPIAPGTGKGASGAGHRNNGPLTVAGVGMLAVGLGTLLRARRRRV